MLASYAFLIWNSATAAAIFLWQFSKRVETPVLKFLALRAILYDVISTSAERAFHTPSPRNPVFWLLYKAAFQLLNFHSVRTKSLNLSKFHITTSITNEHVSLHVFWKLTYTQRVEVQSELFFSVNAVF